MDKEWCKLIGIAPTNIRNIRIGNQQFTKDHIYEACKVFNVSADYIFGFTDQMSSIKEKTTPIQRIKQAVAELEAAKK